MKKTTPTLKEEFLRIFEFKGVMVPDTSTEDVWNFFEPHLKKNLTKSTKAETTIPGDKLKEFNQLWPEFKLPTGTYGRCSDRELTSAFKAFFKEFPDYTDWDIIMNAARVYLSEKEGDKWEYTRRSKYFVRREMKDKSWESMLSEYYQRIKDGVQPVEQPKQGFEPKVY